MRSGWIEIALDQPKVAIITISYNHSELTLACLESLARIDYQNFEIIVVDNGSTDGSLQLIKAAYPNLTIIEAGRNLGFVAGNNAGLNYAAAKRVDYALLLNNDTEVSADFLTKLVEVVESDETIGVVGPMIYYYTEPETIWSAGGKILWSQGATVMLGINEIDHGQFGQNPTKVDFVTGCALLVRMEVIKKAGLLDERFFAYYEETEWCLRIARVGYKVVFVPLARIWHKISPAVRAASPTVIYYMTRNRLLFLHLSGAGWRAWIHVLIFEYLRTLISWTIRPKWRNLATQRKSMSRGIVDYFSGRLGQARE